MSLLDQLVTEALRHQQELSPLRTVVEKELLHHDILREMSRAGLLATLTFMGGTCLRACYGSSRLSEDLDFTGGAGFTRPQLADLASVLVDRLGQKYGMLVEVSEPTHETGNFDTWKLTLQTRPDERNHPVQRIHIDICAIPSYQPRPMMLRNQYGVEMGTSGLILQAESREEILADKLIAFALRPNRVKNRDLWDITWLHQQGIALPVELIAPKLGDHRCDQERFVGLLAERQQSLADDPRTRADFHEEMRRFLPAALVADTIDNPEFWTYLTSVIADACRRACAALSGDPQPQPPRFSM